MKIEQINAGDKVFAVRWNKREGTVRIVERVVIRTYNLDGFSHAVVTGKSKDSVATMSTSPERLHATRADAVRAMNHEIERRAAALLDMKEKLPAPPSTLGEKMFTMQVQAKARSVHDIAEALRSMARELEARRDKCEALVPGGGGLRVSATDGNAASDVNVSNN